MGTQRSILVHEPLSKVVQAFLLCFVVLTIDFVAVTATFIPLFARVEESFYSATIEESAIHFLIEILVRKGRLAQSIMGAYQHACLR